MPTTRDPLTWVELDACTLPTAERPLRLAAFDQLFATSLMSAGHDAPTRASLDLRGGPGLSDHVRALAEAESSCCSFFDFTVTPDGEGVRLDVEVPEAYAEVLAALVRRARTAAGVSA